MSVKDVIEDDLILQTGTAESVIAKGELKPFREAKDQFEKNYIAGILSLAEGNVSRAAKMAGKYRGDIYALLKKHAVDPALFKKED
jgi:two-component system response regulator GlrR